MKPVKDITRRRGGHTSERRGEKWQRHPAAGECWASGWKPLPLSPSLSPGLRARWQRHPASGRDLSSAHFPRFRATDLLNAGRSSRPCGPLLHAPTLRDGSDPRCPHSSYQPIPSTLQSISNALQPISTGTCTHLKSTSTNLECTPTNLECTPTDLERAPTNPERAPTDLERVPTNLERVPTNLECAPTNLERAPHPTQVHLNRSRTRSNQSRVHPNPSGRCFNPSRPSCRPRALTRRQGSRTSVRGGQSGSGVPPLIHAGQAAGSHLHSHSAGTIQLDRSCLLDLLAQIFRPSLVTGLELARASLTPWLAQESAAQSLPSQLNRPGYAVWRAGLAGGRPMI